MHFLSFLSTIWIFISIGKSQLDSFFSENFEPSTHLAFDPMFLMDEPSFGETNSFDFINELDTDIFSDINDEPYQIAESGSNFFLDDGFELNPIIESDPSFFVADNMFCDADGANDVQLFGKIRRQDSCSALLVGQAVQEDESDIRNSPVGRELIRLREEILLPYLRRPLPIFEPSPNICPPRDFGSSNIPVCEVPLTTSVTVTPPGQRGYILGNVYSGVLVYDLNLIIEGLVRNINKTAQ